MGGKFYWQENQVIPVLQPINSKKAPEAAKKTYGKGPSGKMPAAPGKSPADKRIPPHTKKQNKTPPHTNKQNKTPPHTNKQNETPPQTNKQNKTPPQSTSNETTPLKKYKGYAYVPVVRELEVANASEPLPTKRVRKAKLSLDYIFD